MSETEKFQEEQRYFNIKRDISRYVFWKKSDIRRER